MIKAKPVPVRYDDVAVSARLPHFVDIGYDHTYEADVGGEYQDALKPDIVAWLTENVKPRSNWQFCCYIGAPEPNSDPVTGEEFESSAQQFRVRFARENDAFNFKMRWYGAAP